MSLIIGLTGGIASGKSTISNMLKEKGIPVIDADVEARLAVEIGEPAYEEIVSYFGREILNEDHTIDRAKLGAIIFNNEEKRLKLNSIVHPAVRKHMTEKKEREIEKGSNIIVLDIPLLFESKLTYMVDKVLLVYVSEEVQLQRLMNRNQLTEDEATARVLSQMPLKDKLQLADAVIDNNGTIQQSEDQLNHILSKWNN
ncbi:dephospho-CoA kinase [Bacillus sp. 31A1R]|uniref:Dephospho-CoA kinase n=1 Tax=Robertmurraya mangrovi TaxID=3098077 RepID=A0ABU5IZ81_9BACI|nr:dephospho-CoA kinase [Bacillus sp. 31A1R]MDZ5472474.1 dephospho-CoA kinase [Bacillus sp. 31A1R]